MTRDEPLAPESIGALIAGADDVPFALIGIGIPRCPASKLLAASLPAVSRSRPGLVVGYALLTPSDWALRETLLWPRGIRVSRSSVPTLSLLRNGRSVSRRSGGGPAAAIDEWLTATLGAPEHPVQAALTEAERRALTKDGARRTLHAAVKDPDRSGVQHP